MNTNLVEELEFVNRLNQIVLESPDATQMCEELANELRKKMPVEWATIVVIKGDLLYFQSLSSMMDSVWKTSESLPIKGTATEYIATTKQILYEPDLLKEKRFWTGEYHLKQGIRSILYAPLLAQDKVFGAFIIASTKPNAYEEKHLKLLHHTTSQIAMAIRNAILLDEIKKQDQLLQSISHLTKIVLSDIDLTMISHIFSEELKKIVDFDRLSIALIEKENIKYFIVREEIKTERTHCSTYPLKDSHTGWLAEHQKSLIIEDLAVQKISHLSKVKLREGIRSCIHVPLFYKGKIFGTINLSSRRAKAFGEEEKNILEYLAQQISGAIMNAYLYQQLQEESSLDPLTGLFNRRYFNERFHEEIERRQRHGGVFSLAICDLDFFKNYNDLYGHIAGDELLKEVGRIIKNSIRTADIPFRYGGDEFVILFPDTDLEDTFSVAERIRKNIEEEMKKRNVLLTCSFGLALWPVDGVKGAELLNAADVAAFEAKHRGGNQCVFSKMLSQDLLRLEFEIEEERFILNIIRSLITALHSRDIYTYGHSKEVGKYALILGKALDLSKEKLKILNRAALLHDVGKIGIEDRILNKKGGLTEKEWKKIKEHPQKGVEIVSSIAEFYQCRPAILYHHERWDGMGYPFGLKGKEIPLEARILAVADAFSAMTSARTYRSAMPYQKALSELKKQAGKQLDPELVKIFVSEVEKILNKI